MKKPETTSVATARTPNMMVNLPLFKFMDFDLISRKESSRPDKGLARRDYIIY
jgi:hypothetical protein